MREIDRVMHEKEKRKKKKGEKCKGGREKENR